MFRAIVDLGKFKKTGGACSENTLPFCVGAGLSPERAGTYVLRRGFVVKWGCFLGGVNFVGWIWMG